ncbi:MAG TPA: HPF/RaiA family ribosome-associated protein [Vicinamibacterales bacterium]|nr:HPF/RaiA family ribosome-associated protein [Vicinamibacterales bacterium]
MTLIPTQITFRGLSHDSVLDDEIREHVSWLEQFYAGIVRCRVLVEVPHRHRHDGRHFHVRVEVTVPGGAPIVISHEPSLHGRLKDVEDEAHRKDDDIVGVHRYASVAIKEAFDAARRRLEDFAREQRGTVKAHEVPTHGEVAELSKVDGYGFIQAGEHRIYFNRASVLNDAFDALAVGAAVAFVEEKGEKGPQASSVRVLGRHHYLSDVASAQSDGAP